MAKTELGYLDYVKAAFHRKVALPLLGAMPANKMLIGGFAVLGIFNPGFWLLGAAVELGYLFLLASNERFQKLVDGQRLLGIQRSWEERVDTAVAQLPPEGRERYRRLLGQCRRILGISEGLEGDILGDYRDLRSRSLNQLLWIFLRMLGSLETISDNVANLDRGAVEKEIAQLEQRLAAIDRETDPALARSLAGTIDIQRKRLDNLVRGKADLRVIEAELDRIEQQVELIREEAAVSGKPEVLSARLDSVTSAMSQTTRWMDEHTELFGSLGGEETDSAAVDLPRMPVELEGE